MDEGAFHGAEDEVRHEEGEDEGVDALAGAGDRDRAEPHQHQAEQEGQGHDGQGALHRLRAAGEAASNIRLPVRSASAAERQWTAWDGWVPGPGLLAALLALAAAGFRKVVVERLSGDPLNLARMIDPSEHADPKRTFKLRLYRQKRKVYAEDTLQKNRYLRLIESFISEAPCDEVEHGIIENNSIALSEWMTALSVFGGADVDLMSIYNLASKLGRHLNWRNIPNLLIGGTIAGLCKKVTGPESPASVNIMDLLACPDCQIASTHATFDRPPLTEESHGYRCSLCGVVYPVKDGVIFLLPHEELEELYPDF